MHRTLSGFLLAALLAACGHRDTKDPGISQNSVQFLALQDTATFTTIQWLDSSRDYGKIAEGQKLDVSFRFRNTGSTPLVIGHVQPSCGCTVAKQPTEPIAPGAEGQITASFNSGGRVGINHKSLLVNANTKGRQNFSLQFVVEVTKKS